MFIRKLIDRRRLSLSEPEDSRRRFLKTGIGAGALLVLPQVHANILAIKEKQLAFLNLHTGERIRTTYWAEGRYHPEALMAIKNILRDHRTDEAYEMDLNLLNMLQLLHVRMDAREEFHVISAYRSPKTNAMLSSRSSGVATRSLHMQGKAIDIRLPGHALTDLRKAVLSLESGGVGYYPKSNFIHIDTGRVRQWAG
jgi:uncharacterized protein YcbK (DUF882 family)